MNAPLSRILAAIADPAATLDDADLDAVAAEYPFFILPAAEALRRRGAGMTPGRRAELMGRIALNTPDPASVFVSCGDDGADLVHFYPPEKTGITTDDAISKFLDTYGHSDPAQDALLERLIFNPVPPDYTSLLESEGESLDIPPAAEGDTGTALIDAFLASHDPVEPAPAPPVEGAPEPAEPIVEPRGQSPRQDHRHTTPAEDTSLSESLAKIYIRQKRFDKAFEIIHTLSLNNPKKSAYFADQLRFLAKLMLVRGTHKPE